MSIFNDKALKGVADAVSKIMDEELKGNQTKIDANHNGKIDGQDFKILRAKKNVKEEAENLEEKNWIAGAIKKPGALHRKLGVPEGEKIPAAKVAAAAKKGGELGKEARLAQTLKKLPRHHGPRNEEVELDEAFPTVADGEKSLRAKEGKTSSGTVTKTKTGLVHKRDYKDDTDTDDAQKKPSGYGARQNFKRSTRVNEQKLSFTEMLQLYNEAGIEVIAKIAPQTVKFGDTEVEVIDANIVNGAVGITVAEEVDNETFTKEVEAQKAKNAGGGKKAEVAKASVQAVEVQKEETELEEARGKEIILDKPAKHGEFQNRGKSTGGLRKLQTAITKRMSDNKPKKTNEEVEQIDEISSDLAGKYLTASQGKGANKYKTGEGKSRYPSYEAMTKHTKSIKRALQRADTSSLNKKPSYYKEEEQLDEISKGTLGSYIKKASHDVAAKGAFTRHFADKSRAETAEQKHDIARKTMKKADKMQDAGMKRRANMAKAVDRLTKEETQLDEKLPASASAGDYIHDFVHSDNPKFAGKSTKERQKMALGAFYAKNKGK